MDETTNAVLLVKLEALAEVVSINHAINEKAQATILEQCLKTNGRVTTLETAKNMIFGGLIITNVIILPSALILLSKYLS